MKTLMSTLVYDLEMHVVSFQKSSNNRDHQNYYHMVVAVSTPLAYGCDYLLHYAQFLWFVFYLVNNNHFDHI